MNNFSLKNLFFILTVLFSYTCFGQYQTFSILDEGKIEPIVIDIENMNSSELFLKTSEWLISTSKIPEKQILGSVENSFMRFKGHERNFSYIVSPIALKSYLDLEYTFRIDFKNDKYRITPELILVGYDGFLSPTTIICKKNGEIKRAYKRLSSDIISSINTVTLSLYDYLTGKTMTAEDEW